MARKKRQFIDKKTAHRFVLMHRSQQDPLYYNEGGSKLVLHPADRATAKALERLGMGSVIAAGLQDSLAPSAVPAPESNKKRELREVDEMGFPTDGYDYSKHLAPLSGTGTFISKDGQTLSSSQVVLPASTKQNSDKTKQEDVEESDDELMQKKSPVKKEAKSMLQLPGDMFASKKEYDRMLEAITLSADRMDEDMRALLESSDEEEDGELPEDLKDCVGTLDDNFMGQLMEAEKEDVGGDDGFDFDAHVARLMAQAEKEDMGEFSDDQDEEDIDESEMERILGEIASSRPKRDIDEYFDTILENEYGEDEIGELEHATFDERLAGTMDLNSSQMKEALQEFLDEKKAYKERAKMIGAQKENQKSKEQREDSLESNEGGEGEGEDALGEDGTDSDASELDPDEVNSHFGYIARPKEKWDCETIVSTYSILDNHPTVITQNKARRKKMKDQEKLETPVEDQELGFDDSQSMMSINQGVRRDKHETAEEKRMRKRMVKEQQRLRRMEKKSTKEMFREEKLRQKQHAQALRSAAAPPNGASTFKF